MNARRSISELLALAAGLRAWALELLAWLAAHLGAGPVGGALRRWARRELAQAENFATALAVLAALQLLPAPPPARPRGGRRPGSAPRGFALTLSRCPDMRAMRRRLFPLTRNLTQRTRRLTDALGALQERARALAPRIAHCPPTVTLVSIAPPAEPIVGMTHVVPADLNSS